MIKCESYRFPFRVFTIIDASKNDVKQLKRDSEAPGYRERLLQPLVWKQG